MLKQLSARRTEIGVHAQHLHDQSLYCQARALPIHLLKLKASRLDLLKKLVPAARTVAWCCVLTGGSWCEDYDVWDVADAPVAVERRIADHQNVSETADRPHIHRGAVALHTLHVTCEYLWRHVPTHPHTKQ